MSRTITVYCGWRQPPDHPDIEIAQDVGCRLAAAGYDVVTGGGTVGAMGAITAAAHEAGAQVTVVIQKEWVDEIDHTRHELIETDTLTEKMYQMETHADAFVVLAGGRGTRVELDSCWADASNGSHSKPIVVYDPRGVFEKLWEQDRRIVTEGYAGDDDKILHARSIAHVMELLRIGLA